MSDGPAILRAILEDPYDDLPRLAYADWLEETGRDADRMETVSFIRGGLNYPDFETLCAQHRDGKHEMILAFRRGFVCRVELPLGTFIKQAKQLFLTHPITEVKLIDRGPFTSDHFDWVGWFYMDLASKYERCWIPEDVFVLLEGYVNKATSPNYVRWYDTLDLALTALSPACVAYGRQLAKLPPLPTPNAKLIPRL